MHGRWPLAGALALGLVLSVGASGASAGQATGSADGGDGAGTAWPAAETVSTVTLITGDRVSLVDGTHVVVDHGPGREDVTYVSQRTDGDLHVIPSDAVPLLRDGRLDRRLFNVSLLVKFGYHDRPDLPLIVVEGSGNRAAGRLAAPSAAPSATSTVDTDGVDVVWDLPAVGGSAVRVDKSTLGGFWDSLVGRPEGITASGAPTLRSAGATSSGAPTVWLDGLRQPLLDQSVPHVGAPHAWAGGLDGSGITVAVLDTGVDATHPDLSDRIIGSENFTEGREQDGDFIGHGTHVASTVAGSGAASGGQYRGVAPGAQLLDGKVCVRIGCPESSILAGMQWAAEQGADVINMSLGGLDTAGWDPVEQAVENLTTQFGTLFVISAGNAGVDRSIWSPGSADSALTVGAVDRTDRLASFSSRGPRIDGALKPDLTAPGWQIVAARSSTGSQGQPGEPYLTLSGTSMAAPHVAGAAAILRQQHPDWSPAQVKAALMGSSAPNPTLSPYAQGAGRLDLARAITQDVMAQPPSVSFARAEWPYDDDVTQSATVTYHNRGSVDVTLSLEMSTRGPDGGPAPDGFFVLSDPDVTVPAGGSAQVSLSADTSVGELEGFFTGYLTATGPDVQVSTPFAVELEVESYNVTVVHTDREGEPADHVTALYRTDQAGVVNVPGPPSVTVRVPAGEYTLTSFVRGAHSTLMAQPRLVVDEDVTVQVDAREADPISITVPEPGATQAMGLVNAEISTNGQVGSHTVLTNSDATIYSGRIGPDEAVPGFTSSVAGSWLQFDPVRFFSGSPYRYDLSYYEAGRMLTGFSRDVKKRELATVVAQHAAHAPGGLGSKATFGLHPGDSGGISRTFRTELPFTITEYHNTDGGVVWLKILNEDIPRLPFPAPQTVSIAGGPPEAYQARRTYHETWNQGVFGPGLPEASQSSPVTAYRIGDELTLAPELFNDGAGRTVWSLTPQMHTAVYRDGELIFEAPDLYAEVQVPPQEAVYRVEVEATRDHRFPLSTHASLVWTFRSGHVDDVTEVPLPVSVVRFTPALDDHNAAPAGRAFPMPVRVVAQDGAAPLVDLAVEISYDDGQTWQEAPVRGNGRLLVPHHPAGDGFVSLRVSAADADGNTVEQTIIRAYRFAAAG